MPSVIIHFHLNKHVTWKKFPFTFTFLAGLHFNYFFRRHNDFTKTIFSSLQTNAFTQCFDNIIFKARVSMNDIPSLYAFFFSHLKNLSAIFDLSANPLTRKIYDPIPTKLMLQKL